MARKSALAVGFAIGGRSVKRRCGRARAIQEDPSYGQDQKEQDQKENEESGAKVPQSRSQSGPSKEGRIQGRQGKRRQGDPPGGGSGGAFAEDPRLRRPAGTGRR